MLKHVGTYIVSGGLGDFGLEACDFLIEREPRCVVSVSLPDAIDREHLSQYDVESAVVTLGLPLLEGQSAAIPLLEDIVVRRPRIKLKGLETAANSMATVTTNNDTIEDETVPTHPIEREKWVYKRLRECVARALMMDDMNDIGSRLSDLGWIAL